MTVFLRRAVGPETLVLHDPGMVNALRLLTPEATDEERLQPPLSPLYGDLTDMPPALLFAGELDPLLDDTVQMAERWAKSSEVEVHVTPVCAHGFIHFPTAMTGRVLARSHRWVSDRISAVTR